MRLTRIPVLQVSEQKQSKVGQMVGLAADKTVLLVFRTRVFAFPLAVGLVEVAQANVVLFLCCVQSRETDCQWRVQDGDQIALGIDQGDVQYDAAQWSRIGTASVFNGQSCVQLVTQPCWDEQNSCHFAARVEEFHSPWRSLVEQIN